MNNKNDIYFRLTSSVIIDFLKNYSKENKNIIFSEAECSGYKSIRFSTITLENDFKSVNKNIGYFKNGHFAYYEIKPEKDYWCLYLNISKVDISYDLYIKLSNISHNIVFENEDYVTLYKYDLVDINSNAQDVIEELYSFLQTKITLIESQVLCEENLSLNEEESFKYNANDDFYIEGALEQVFNNKYERNQEARKKCLEYYGTKCQICGFDFSKVYGNEFSGKIHVHHRVPLHKIKKEYVVDPIKDLIPVCPNCHMVLHSKENGTYTVEEVKRMLEG